MLVKLPIITIEFCYLKDPENILLNPKETSIDMFVPRMDWEISLSKHLEKNCAFGFIIII